MTHQTRTFTVVAMCVFVLHAAALWALQAGLVIRKPPVVVPVHLLARMVEPPPPPLPVPQPVVVQKPVVPNPAPQVRKPRPVRSNPVAVVKQPSQREPEPVPPAPVLTTSVAIAEPTPVPIVPAAPAPAVVVRPSASSHASAVGTSAATAEKSMPLVPVPQASRPAPAAVELPSSNAQYLKNPRPSYPMISLRLREQGTVLVDVLVSEQGWASEAKVKTSSGFFRLDNAAVSTVLTWRFIPGKRAGVAQSMWFIVPITFSIQ